MSSQAERWRALASELGIAVTAPVTMPLSSGLATFTVLLPQFGAKNGMVADPDWEAIGPHERELLDAGYGFSTVGISGDLESAKSMLRDWGWSAPEPKPSWW